MFSADHTSSLSPAPFASILGTIEEQAGGQKLSKTGKHLADLREEARQEGLAEGKEEGHQAGYIEGQAEGREFGRKEAYDAAMAEHRALLSKFQKELKSFVKELTAEAQNWSAEAERALTEAVSTMAREVLGQELALGRESVLAIVKKSLSEAGVTGQIRLRLNPKDRPFIEKHQEELRQEFAQVTGLSLIDDLTIPAGCIIETGFGSIDATPERQIEEFEEQLREEAA